MIDSARPRTTRKNDFADIARSASRGCFFFKVEKIFEFRAELSALVRW